MNSLKNALEIIWTIWSLFIAGLIIAINFPIMALFIAIWGEKESGLIDYYLRFCSRLILVSWGIRMIFINDKKLDFSNGILGDRIKRGLGRAVWYNQTFN